MSRNQRGDAQCQAFNARPLHQLVERQLLLALSPVSIELSLHAARNIESDRQQVARHHQQTVERARYQSELAGGRYEAVDHHNRLVAAELERRWEAALLEQRQAEESLDRLLNQQPVALTPAETKHIAALSEDIPSLWHAESTSGIARQTVLRALVEQVVVEVLGESERVTATIRWAGGFESHHEIRRAVGKFDKLESADTIRSRVLNLKQRGYTHGVVAEALNAEGFCAVSGGLYTSAIVSQLYCRFRAEGSMCDSEEASSNHWRLAALARQLGIRSETLSTWRRRGWVDAEQVGRRWILWADEKELSRLKQLADHQRKGLRRTPSPLTTPNKR